MNTILKTVISVINISFTSVLFLGLLSGCCTNDTVLKDNGHTHTATFSYQAQGSEPDWVVTVTKNDRLLFSTQAMPENLQLAANRHAFAKGVEYTGIYQNKPFALVLKAGECTDSMADKKYEMTAIFEFNEQTYKGCAD